MVYVSNSGDYLVSLIVCNNRKRENLWILLENTINLITIELLMNIRYKNNFIIMFCKRLFC